MVDTEREEILKQAKRSVLEFRILFFLIHSYFLLMSLLWLERFGVIGVAISFAIMCVAIDTASNKFKPYNRLGISVLNWRKAFFPTHFLVHDALARETIQEIAVNKKLTMINSNVTIASNSKELMLLKLSLPYL